MIPKNTSLENLSSIAHHQSQLGINRAVGISHSRYRVFRRHRCRRYGVREDLCSHQKGADEAKRNRR